MYNAYMICTYKVCFIYSQLNMYIYIFIIIISQVCLLGCLVVLCSNFLLSTVLF